MKKNDKVLLVDGLNTFLRSFAMVKQLNPQGHHVGGLVGFLKSLSHMVRVVQPSRVICIFDGRGSSTNRKNLDPEYKANRKIAKITQWEIFNSLEEEKESITNQLGRLHNYLELIPVHTLQIDKLEADDVIAALSKKLSAAGKKVVIASSDRDFIQLIDSNITVYSPIKKKFYTPEKVLEEYGITPKNFIYMKCLLGDTSDNIRGVKGVGPKTIEKQFPELAEDEEFTLEKIYTKASSMMSESKKAYAKIVYDWDRIELNYKLMSLHEIELGQYEQDIVANTLSSPIPKMNTFIFKTYLNEDGINDITRDTQTWLHTFGYLSKIK